MLEAMPRDSSVPLTVDIGRVALRQRRTKIVATVGPASSTEEQLGALLAAGVNVFRLNFSHGTHEQHGAVFERIRRVAETAGAQVAVLADLCGPKIRVGMLEGGSVTLETGGQVTLTVREGATSAPGVIPSEYRELAGDVKPGDRILLDDGKMELRVLRSEGTEVSCEVVFGGVLRSRKGINLPGVQVSAPALTEKDRADATFAAQLGVDFLALSFVRSAADVLQLKALLADLGAGVPVIAKIEKPEAVQAFGSILEVSDGIMVARGDLGVEMAPEEVPLIQRELVRLSMESSKPVIVATQMLESMIENPRPTRAEVTDVAFAAIGGADAVMLSAETASGAHPLEAVKVMDRVLRMIEGYQWVHGQFGRISEHALEPREHREADAILGEALSRAAAQVSRDVGARAVVVPTKSGRTARLISGDRPAAPVVAIVDDPAVARRLVLHWGVTPEVVPSLEHPAPLAVAAVQRLGLAEPGQFIVLVWDPRRASSGVPSVTALKV
jgi:pyruvate kinase